MFKTEYNLQEDLTDALDECISGLHKISINGVTPEGVVLNDSSFRYQSVDDETFNLILKGGSTITLSHIKANKE